MCYQSVLEKHFDRKDHSWKYDETTGVYKCCLCGATTKRRPPKYPTPKDWMPDKFELPLTEEERDLARREAGV